jgi:hypothetical protein
VTVGDAENDLPMLTLAGCGVAVDNALDSVKTKSDLMMQKDHGEGVEELIEGLLQDNLAQSFAPRQSGFLQAATRTAPQHNCATSNNLKRAVQMSGKGTASLTLPPLRTGLDGFPSFGSSRV